MLQGADKLEHVTTEHFWMSGMYWGLTAMALMGKLDQMDSAKVLDWVSV
jgi:geranylgeranyl transferase type-2 subunit beta